MKPHFLEKLEHRFMNRPSTGPRDGDTPDRDARLRPPEGHGKRFREWMAELSEDLANIDRSGKDEPPGSH